MRKFFRKHSLISEIVFFLLMIILSPLMIVLITIGTISSLVYLPFDYIIYKKYSFLGKYFPLITIKKRKEIKEYKYGYNNNFDA